jgi:hypothetical protein
MNTLHDIREELIRKVSSINFVCVFNWTFPVFFCIKEGNIFSGERKVLQALDPALVGC